MHEAAYYRGRDFGPAVARHYFRQFGDARRVLDVGCGTGALGRFKPSSGMVIFGVDVDRGVVAEATRFEDASVVDLDAAPLPFGDSFFDAVLARDILEHVVDPGALTSEIARVLAPGGTLVVSAVMAKPSAVWDDYTHRRGFTKRSLRMLLEDHQLAVVAIRPMGPVPLAGRLRFVGALPFLLRLPIASSLWAVSWEALARKAP